MVLTFASLAAAWQVLMADISALHEGFLLGMLGGACLALSACVALSPGRVVRAAGPGGSP